MINFKKLICIFIILSMAEITVSATNNSTLYKINKISGDQEVSYSNNIHTRWELLDSSNQIYKGSIKLKNNNLDNTALKIDFDNNWSYTVKVTKYYLLFILPYKEINTIIYNRYNETCCIISNKTSQINNIFDKDIEIEFEYIYQTGKSIFDVPAITGGQAWLYQGNFSISTSTLEIWSMSPFDITIYINDILEKQDIDRKKAGLSGISKFIYSLITVGGLYDSELLLSLFSLIDTFFYMTYILSAVLFKYPYLVAVWILSIGNMWVAWKSTTVREMMFNYSDYFKAVGSAIYQIFTFIYTQITALINIILGLIP